MSACVQHLLERHRELEKILEQLASVLEWREQKTAQPTCGNCLGVTGTLAAHLTSLLQKKEAILFPALEGFLNSDSGPLAVLRAEDEELRSRLAGLHQAVKALTADCSQEQLWNEFGRSGQELIGGIRDQIYKEDRVFFPMISRMLSPQQDQQLIEQMEEIDGQGAADPVPADSRSHSPS